RSSSPAPRTSSTSWPCSRMGKAASSNSCWSMLAASTTIPALSKSRMNAPESLSARRFTTFRLCAVIPLLLATACLPGAGFQAQEPTSLKSRVNLVNVAFAARDSRGALVDNLTQDDVEVFEDNVPQKVAFFAKSVDVPLTLGLIVDASGSQEHFSKKHEKDLE